MWLWQRAGWPALTWNAADLTAAAARARLRQGQLLGQMRGLGFDLGLEAEAQVTFADVMGTSAIEGEALAPASVRSSIAHRLGLPGGRATPRDRSVEGLVDVVLEAVRGHAEPLTTERLFRWHAALFPQGRSGLERIRVGAWRDDAGGPMQVVSGAFGRERVHFEAPPAKAVSAEVRRLLTWFAKAPHGLDPLLRVGLAHLWFLTVHPFDDGNGRLARALADLALAQSDGAVQRFYSLSSQWQLERAEYYAQLEAAQRGGLDVTDWLAWFLASLERAFDSAERQVTRVQHKASFWRRHAWGPPLNARQRKVLEVLLADFQGPMTAQKWAHLCRCSVDTAQRDIADLVTRGLLLRNEGAGKRTSYRFTG